MKYIIDHKESKLFRKLHSYNMQIYLSLYTNPRKVLEIGLGEGYVSHVLKKYCELKTADIDPNLNPDIILDISELEQFKQFKDNEYDLIIICEVLEHVPFNLFESILKSLKRITKNYVLISLPNQNHFLNFVLFKRGYDKPIFYPFNYLLKCSLHLFNKLGKLICQLHYKIKKRSLKFKKQNDHYWEIGIDKYSEDLIRNKIKNHFRIEKDIRLRQNTYHHFYLLKKN